MANSTRPKTLELTTNPAANALIAQDWTAFLIGWVLDQQMKVQKAFEGPLLMKQRLGTLDPKKIAKLDVETVVEAFLEKPAIHRYARSMGERVHACMITVVHEFDSDVESVWREAKDYKHFTKRITSLPGIGPGKVGAIAATLAKRFSVPITGWEDSMMPYGSISDVVVYEDLLAYQERKSAYKKKLRGK